ncbi:hypothetical protein T492DRAFT_842117 [Pavlovales sp. CCMP2436]|nr:hypothetical protein T492DRAFT_842117 [Pavlovales sp. CCMP2436]
MREIPAYDHAEDVDPGSDEERDRSMHSRRTPTLSVVAAVRVLDEGVDVPACDSVFFAHKPVASDTAMASSFDVELAGALELLRDEDPQLSRKVAVRGCVHDVLSASPEAAMAVELDEAELTSAFVERFQLTGVSFGEAAWQRTLAALTAYKVENGHCLVPQSHRTSDGFNLGTAVGSIRMCGIDPTAASSSTTWNSSGTRARTTGNTRLRR